MVDEKKEIYRLWWEFLKRSKIYKSIYENHEEIKTLLLRNPKIADKEIENILDK